MNNAVMRAQSYAVQIEHIMSSVFKCERYGIGGLVNSDYIRKHPYAAMVATLTYRYYDLEHQANKFIDKYCYYADWSIDTLLGFESNISIINGSTYIINYSNGEEALKTWIQDFKQLLNSIE